MNKSVQDKFDSYPDDIKPKMLELRQLILHVAASDPKIGPIDEALKWGEPSFLTSQSKIGTTIRIDWKPKMPDQIGLYVHCQTSLVDTYRSMFPDLRYEGNRAVLLDVNQPLPERELRICIHMALAYHL
jgi:hypothetical protein